jgi:hypothetical protein
MRRQRAGIINGPGQLRFRMLEVQGEGEAGTRAALEFVARGIAAQAAVDELTELCFCGHVRATHVRTDGSGPCSEKLCGCLRFGKDRG